MDEIVDSRSVPEGKAALVEIPPELAGDPYWQGRYMGQCWDFVINPYPPGLSHARFLLGRVDALQGQLADLRPATHPRDPLIFGASA